MSLSHELAALLPDITEDQAAAILGSGAPATIGARAFSLAQAGTITVRGGGDNCRFTYNGRGLRIEDGYRYPKGTNIMHQAVYWTMTKATVKKVAKWLGPGVKAHWHSREA